MTAVLETQGLGYVYLPGTPMAQRALQDISFGIQAGESVALLGPTGCGKSTLVAHFNGLVRPTEGTMRILGQDVRRTPDLRPLRFRVGLVFQSPEAQLFEETVFQEIAFGPRNMRLSTDDIRSRVERACATVGLELATISERSPFALSGGEQRRVAIASVLAMEPEVVVFDEPTAGLDPEGQAQCVASIRALQAAGRTLILVSHDLELVSELTQRVLVLDRGRLIWDGDLRGALHASLPGLRPTPSGQLCRRLAERGWSVPTDLTSVEEAAAAIAPLLRSIPPT